jgi:4-alpha-glucanotransferase
MKLTLHICYHTKWGESLFVTGNIPQLGSNNVSAAQPMRCDNSQYWSLSIDLPEDICDFEYSYFVKNNDGSLKREWGTPHRFSRGVAIDNSLIVDFWQDIPEDKPLYSSAFVDCINRRQKDGKPELPHRATVTFHVFAPSVKPNEVLALLGETSQLGNWNPQNAAILNDCNFPEWSISLDWRALPQGSQYKFAILDKSTREVIAWEDSENHVMTFSPIIDGATYISMRINTTQPKWRGAGVAIPVFSLRSDEDFGVGDFYDLKKMIDWAVQTGQSFVQVLPINDTTMSHTWTDSYPYNANSTFALHPMYLRLQELGTLNDKKRQKYFDQLGAKLNLYKKIDYEQVTESKIQFFKEIYAQEGDKTLESDQFKSFFARNEHWLKPYAAYCVLRDKFKTPEFSKWGQFATYDKAKIEEFISKNQYDIGYVYYLQFNLDKQLCHVRDYARSQGVAIKGDIPIGISRTSVDAWTHPRLFYMDCQAGAPPDDFAVLGQNWGFPTYNWSEMAKDGFAWWKARFCKMSEYFDAYRIDHVLGFFRIWQIPMDAVHGLLGYFNPALPFSVDELKERYSFEIKHELYTKPYITDEILAELFGDCATDAKSKYLTKLHDGRYQLKTAYNSQRKIVDYFAKQAHTAASDKMRDTLMLLLDEVLFIEDAEHPNMYHPRISAQLSHAYKALNDGDRYNFDRLYEDFFYHRHNDFWREKAMEKLPPLIDATGMLVCAEDLGMIPACVSSVMNSLKILSLEIQRMPKGFVEFGDTAFYPYLSVCTTSTHDMGGIRLWWEENHDAMQRYYNYILHKDGVAPYFCEPGICNSIVKQHLNSPAMLCILPLQDYLSIDGNLRRDNAAEEQINNPANSRHYWRYRMHLTLEQLLNAHRYNVELKEVIVKSGR